MSRQDEEEKSSPEPVYMQLSKQPSMKHKIHLTTGRTVIRLFSPHSKLIQTKYNTTD
jgi:hypothetical protein